MVEHLGRNRLAIQNPRRDGVGHRRLQMSGVVTEIEVTRGTLVEPVDQFAQIAAAKLALFPTLEGFSDWQESAPPPRTHGEGVSPALGCLPCRSLAATGL